MNLLAVFVGGLVGAGLRLGIDALLPHAAGGFPLSTLIINITGSFVLGLLVAWLWPVAPEWLRFGLGTGLLGTFTTFSAVLVSLIQLTLFAPEVGILYLGVTLVGGLGAAWLGLRLGARLGPDRARRPRVTEGE